MELNLAEQKGKIFLEGAAGQPLLRDVMDTVKIIEACFNNQTRCLLLYAENLTDYFFDLSSLEAGTILQKLRNYEIRLAVVRSSARPLSHRFGDLMVEENRDRYFHLFDDRHQAATWLCED
jgi:hypothetical protein